MVLYVNTQDIDTYPGTVKKVAIDQVSVVPIGYDGDEQYVLTIGTSAYSDNVAKTAIQTVYMADMVTGWCKSSGYAGTGGSFPLASGTSTFKIKIDATVSGSDGSGYYDVVLSHNDGEFIQGSVVAADMQDKIRNLTVVTGDAGYALSYQNASVEYINGKFWIISGSLAKYYTGANRSSVLVASGTTNDCTTLLGFDNSMTSMDRAALTVNQTLLAADYTADTASMTVAQGTNIQAGTCCVIKDSTGNSDTFQVVDRVDNVLTIPTNGANGHTGISNNYEVAYGAYIQILQEQDPDMTPESWFGSIDSIVRFGIKNVVNQIDYSS